MNDTKLALIFGMTIFIVAFLVNYFIIFKKKYKIISKPNKKNYKKIEDFIGLSILVPKFKLDIKKMNLEYVFVLCSIINAFIIAFTVILIFLIPWELPFKLLLSFVILFALMYSCYELLGRHLVKKGWTKK